MATYKAQNQCSKTEVYKSRFLQADQNGDGFLNIREFHDMMRLAGSKMTDRQIAEIFVFFDGPMGDRKISFEEFCNGCERIQEFEQKARRLFQELDTSGDGQLQKEELKVLLDRSGRSYTAGELDSMFRKADLDGNKSISLEEFLGFYT